MAVPPASQTDLCRGRAKGRAERRPAPAPAPRQGTAQVPVMPGCTMIDLHCHVSRASWLGARYARSRPRLARMPDTALCAGAQVRGGLEPENRKSAGIAGWPGTSVWFSPGEPPNPAAPARQPDSAAAFHWFRWRLRPALEPHGQHFLGRGGAEQNMAPAGQDAHAIGLVAGQAGLRGARPDGLENGVPPDR